MVMSCSEPSVLVAPVYPRGPSTMEPANSYLRLLWAPIVRCVFNLPLNYFVPMTKLLDYVWFLEREYSPLLAKAMHCQTVVDCACWHCNNVDEEDWCSGYTSC